MPQFNLEDYVDTNERIDLFWAKYPEGRIETNLMSDPHDFTQCRYVAKVYRELNHSVPAATGWAFELAGGAGPNRTSHEENCETSAIGRALANMGFATSKNRASKQEMSKVTRESAVQTANRVGLPATIDTETGEVAPKLMASQRKRIFAIAHEVWPKAPGSAFDPADVNIHDLIGRKWRVGSVNDLTEAQAKAFIDYLDTLPKVPLEARRLAAHQQGELVTAGVAKAIRDYTS
jgi:hypothetical protein